MRHRLNRRTVLALGAFVGAIIFMVLLAMRPSADLEAWKRSMSARGERFNLAEIVPPFSQDRVDWEVSFSNLVQKLASGPHTPGLLQLMNTNAEGSAPLVWQSVDPLGSMTPVDFWSSFGIQMSNNEAVLGEIASLLSNPPSGSVYDPSSPIGNWTTINLIARRTAAQNLSAAAVCAMHEDRLDRAITHLETLITLAEASDPGGLIIDQLIRTAIAGLALNLTWEISHAPGWADARLVRLQRRWEDANILTSFSRVLESERAFGVACFDHARTNESGLSSVIGTLGVGTQPLTERVRDASLNLLWRSSYSEEDEFLFLRASQVIIDGIRSAQTNAVYGSFRDHARVSRTIVDTETKGAYAKLRHPLSIIALSNWEKSILTAWKHESFRRVTIYALAIRRHQLQKSSLPDDLKALVPNFLPSELPDPMSGHPLRYRRLSDELFLLYSVGENGEDDDGSGDDIYWPQVAQPDSL